MDAALYDRIAEVEEVHWWFQGRRAIVDALLSRLNLPKDAQLLEAGCGSGGNLAMLCRHGRVRAFELEPALRQRAAARAVCPVASGRLPDDLPFGDERFDTIVLLDVLEHLDDDVAALQALRARLKAGGSLLVTVPAFQFLWSVHDDLNHHRRRYRAGQLRRAAQRAGLRVELLSYFNFFLFPAAVLAKTLAREGGESAELAVPSPAANRLLGAVFASERLLVPHLSLPFGVSLAMVARSAD